MVYGEVAAIDLFHLDFADVPASFDAAKTWVNQENIAVVNNPVVTDRLNLREEPKTSAPSMGKFYNGTPLYVIESKGDWTYVAVGRSGLTGWMMTRYLAFGADSNNVASAFESLYVLNDTAVLYRDARMKEKVGTVYRDRGNFYIVGIAGKTLYLVILDDGEVGYAYRNDFWPGNG